MRQNSLYDREQVTNLGDSGVNTNKYKASWDGSHLQKILFGEGKITVEDDETDEDMYKNIKVKLWGKQPEWVKH